MLSCVCVFVCVSFVSRNLLCRFLICFVVFSTMIFSAETHVCPFCATALAWELVLYSLEQGREHGDAVLAAISGHATERLREEHRTQTSECVRESVCVSECESVSERRCRCGCVREGAGVRMSACM